MMHIASGRAVLAERELNGNQSIEARERALQIRLQAGGKVEDISEMTPRYREVLEQTMLIAADLEMSTLGFNYPAILNAPTLDAKISIMSAVQDELGHAQVTYRLLEDFGYDTEELLFRRDPKFFRTFYLVQHPVNDYVTAVISMLIGDRAGYTTTLDIEESCSYGPYSRSLRKVNFEEKFHVAYGEKWTEYFWNKGPKTRKRIQDAVDFYFPLGATWFGLPDHMKTRPDQLQYKVRAQSNDALRQRWLAQVVPFCERVGIKIPAHFDREKGQYVLDYEMPILLNEETGKWDFRTVTWEEQFAQWKKGGPIKTETFRRLQDEVWGDDLW